MNPAQLLAHFDRISDAPDAIPRLRRFVLDLAVRGRLVEQDPRDVSALELLGRIETEKLKLIKEGKLKRQESLSPVNEDELPFPVPHGWQPTRLAVVAACLDYMREPINSTERDQRVSGKNPSELFPYFGATQQQGWIDDYIFDEELVLLGEDGVPFFDDLRSKAYLISGKTWVNNHAHVFRCILVSPAFLVHYLNTFDYKGRVAGATRSKLNQAKAVDIPIILPPLAEQHRIVAKVDELMALCDRFEAAQAERENRRDRLAASSLNRLNNGADPDAFRDHARFYFNHLPRLTTKPEHIQQLRQTILSLAVRGKLVPQAPDHEPASELLKRIRAEKERLVQEGKIKPLRPLIEICQETMPFRLPTNWQWVRFGELIIDADAGWSPKSEGFPRAADNWGVLKVSAVSWDKFLPEENKQLLPGLVPPKAAQVRAGDFLISRANTSELVAKCVVVGDEPRNLILSDKIVRLHISASCDKRFLCIVNNHAGHARLYYAEEASGTSLSMKNVSRAVIYALVIPLPPLAEQQRIVAKVDELMALCDRLEGQLSITQTNSRRLLEAILHEALAT